MLNKNLKIYGLRPFVPVSQTLCNLGHDYFHVIVEKCLYTFPRFGNLWKYA